MRRNKFSWLAERQRERAPFLRMQTKRKLANRLRSRNRKFGEFVQRLDQSNPVWREDVEPIDWEAVIESDRPVVFR